MLHDRADLPQHDLPGRDPRDLWGRDAARGRDESARLPTLPLVRGRLDRPLERVPDRGPRRRETWAAPFQVNDNPASEDTEALQPNLGVAPSGTVAVAFYDRRLPCPSAGPEAASAGLRFDPNAPYGATDYCVNTAVQFYRATLAPIGHNVRLSDTLGPQLSAPHAKCVCNPETFIGDYFGIDSGGGWTYTTSVSTYDDGLNPSNYQQQIVSRIATP